MNSRQAEYLKYIARNPGCTSGDLIRARGCFRYGAEARSVYESVKRLVRYGLVRRRMIDGKRKGLYLTFKVVQ